MDKDKVLAIAEDIAFKEHEVHYYQLGLREEAEVWRRAEQEYNDRVASEADAERSRVKEGL